MRNVLRAAFCCYLSAVLCWTSTASATTLVAKVEKDRIILAADIRRTMFAELSDHPPLPPDDHMCKISALSKVGFAATGGLLKFHLISGPPVVGDWSADEDAKSSYLSHPDNLFEIAEDWKARTIQHYTALYSVAQKTVEELAGSNPGNVLIIGLFAGRDDKGRPTLISERISLDRVRFTLSLIVSAPIEVLHERERPYSTNDDTNKLTDIESELGKATAKKWAMRAKQFPKSERDWRWVAFLIESTSAYDKAVAKNADVLEIQTSGSHWLQRSACGTKRKPQKAASQK